MSDRSVHAFQGMSEILLVDREGLGDVNMEVTHVKSKHNREMVRREVVQRLNGLSEGEIPVIVRSMMAWKLW